MAITFVKATELRTTGNSASGSVTSTAGNALIAVCCAFSAGSIGIFSVSGGGTWTTDRSGTQTLNMRGGFASTPSATGGTQTISVTATNATGLTAFILEFSGLAASGIFEGAGTTNSGASATKSTNALTNTQATAVKVAESTVDGSTNTAWSSTGTGWTLPTNGSEPDGTTWLIGASGYKIVSASASDTETWSRTGADNFIAEIATYLDSPSTSLPAGEEVGVGLGDQSALAAMLR